MKSVNSRRERGSVLVESVFALALVVIPLMAFQLELIRAMQYRILLQHMSFIFVRDVALGKSDSRARTHILEHLRPVFRGKEYSRLERSLGVRSDRKGQFIRGRLWYRYPRFFPELAPDRLQMTTSCRFSS